LHRRLSAVNSRERNIDSCYVACSSYAIKNVIVASQLYDVADVQFTVEKEGPLELCSKV